MTTYSTISFCVKHEIGHLLLNQPPSNSMSADFFLELNHLIEEIRLSEDIRALVISGKGRHFSSGVDLPTLLQEITTTSRIDQHGKVTLMPDFLTENSTSMLLLGQLPIPVISAIRGVCLGSAMELALSSHFRFSGEDAVFGLPEASFNLIPGLGGTRQVASLSGNANAIELVLKGKTFTASDALRLNLIDRILPKKDLLQTSLDFARSISGDYFREKKKLYLRNYFSS